MLSLWLWHQVVVFMVIYELLPSVDIMLNVSLFFSIVKLLLIMELYNDSKEQLLEFPVT